MTPKEAYEVRKAGRAKLKDLDYQVRQRTEQLMFLDVIRPAQCRIRADRRRIGEITP